ncbi:flagellar hook-length control protein FliK [Hafnia psychrotolerans]|uniref:Flagellar hook-length control protein n=1 Tax=Hafnia psychrotolerans TaxID=1477018 RepID=A0ABQ1GQ71_9GAMM|nr:flagellar hook-length control protein FliK [Hafnia psychrotolerans]GGA47842.1 flagellar hook-length control protein [Hafnia psychrotolerans]
MNMNIVPAAVTPAKIVATGSKTITATDDSAMTDADASTATGDFATQLEAQLEAKPVLSGGSLTKPLRGKDQGVDNHALAQAVNAGAKTGTLSQLDQTQLKQVMTAIQSLPASSLKTADLSALKNLITGDKDEARDAKAEDASTLPIQALFAMLAAQPVAATAATATAQNASPPKVDDGKDKTTLLQSLSGDAKALLAGEDKTADHKTAVTDSKSITSSPSPATANKTSNESDFSNAMAAMTAASSSAMQPDGQQKSADNSSLLQTLSQVNTAAMAAPSATVSSTPTTTSLVNAPSVPQLNAQLGTPEWQQQLGQQVMMFNRQGLQTAELRLNPQDLGSIQIRMKIEDGQAQMHFVSGHSGVRAALEAAMPQLRTSLADSGINLSQSNVSSDNSQWQQQQQQQQAFQQSGQQSGSSQGNAASWAAFNGISSASASDALPVPASLQQLANGKSGVDIFA